MCIVADRKGKGLLPRQAERSGGGDCPRLLSAKELPFSTIVCILKYSTVQ